jgi:hypothetical protein
MGSLILGDLMLLFFSIYVGVFFRHFHSSYPDMSVGFHLWEVCYNKETWYYGNKLASRLAIILGLLFFAILYPLLLYIGFKRSYLVIVLISFFILYFILLFVLVKIRMRKKFNLKDK